MLRYFIVLVAIVSLYSCRSTTKSAVTQTRKEKPVRIANDSLEYEVIIFDIGFNTFLNSRARPRGFYGPQTIDYESKIDYGYEVNYLLFNYFLFFEQKYNQRL